MPDYKPWRSAPRDLLTQRDQAAFDNNSSLYAEQYDPWAGGGGTTDEGYDPWSAPSAAATMDRAFSPDRFNGASPPPPPAPPPKKSSGGGGWLGKLTDIAEGAGNLGLDVLGKVEDAASPVLSWSRENVGEPVFGALSGVLAADRKPIYDRDGNVVGYKRDTSNLPLTPRGLLDTFGGVAEGIAHPGRAAEAWREYEAGAPGWKRAALATVSDPLSYLGGGTSLGIVLGINEAGAAVDAYGNEIPGWRNLDPRLQEALVFAGGAVAGHYAGKGAPFVRDRVAEAYRTVLGPEGKLVEPVRRVAPGFGGSVTEDVSGGEPPTVKRATLWNGVEDTYQTEGELNGYRPEQGGMALDMSSPTPAPTESPGPLKRPDLVRVPTADIKTREDLFQARGADEGKSYSESRVRDIVSDFDQNKLTPGIVVHDTSTGDYVVLAGHHRLEVQRRLAAAGKWPNEGTWEVIDADLSNPAHVAEIQKLADFSNYGVADTTFAENLNVYRRARARGETHDDIIQAMRSVPKQAAEDLRLIDALPEDVVSRVATEPGTAPVAAEIGRARITYGLNDTDARGLYSRYANGGRPRTEVRRILEAYGRLKSQASAESAQGGFFGDDWNATQSKALTSIDAIVGMETDLASQRRRLVTLRNGLNDVGAAAPEIRGQAEAMVRALERRITMTEEALDAARAGDLEGARARLAAGTADERGGAEPPVPSPDVENPQRDQGAAGAAPEPQLSASPPATQAAVEIRQRALDLQGRAEPMRPSAQSTRTMGQGDLLPPEPGARVVEGSVPHVDQPAEGQGNLLPGRLPRPEGEPKTVEVVAGLNRTVDEMRAEAPPGYRLMVPDEGAPQYRRVLSNDDIQWMNDHPIRPAVGKEAARSRFPQGMAADDVADAWANAVAEYHPRWSTPSPSLRPSYDRLASAARRRFTDLEINDMLAEVGADSLQELEPQMRKALLKSARENARRTMGEIEREVASEEWHQPLRELMGAGFGEGRPTGGVGGVVEEPPLMPPPKSPEGPPTGGRGGTQPLGSTPPEDLLKAPSRDAMLADATQRRASLVGRLGEKVADAWENLRAPENRMDVDTKETIRGKVDPVLRVKNLLDNRINHLAEWELAKERAVLAQSGIEVKAVGNEYHLFADGRDVGLFEDVVERNAAGTAGYESLNDVQKQAISVIESGNDRFNGTILFHGGDPAIDPEIGGSYFGRRVTGREYVNDAGETVRVEKAQSNEPGRTVGAVRDKSRVMESIEEGLRKGFTYENPWEARLQILRGKLMTAEDAYLKANVEPLRVREPGSTMGLSQIAGHRGFAGQWYDPAVAKRIAEGLAPRRDNAVTGAIRSVNSVLLPLRASFDLSATLQQGLRMWLSDPKHAAEYWWTVTRSLGDEKLYDKLLLKLHNDGPGVDQLLGWGLRFTGENSEDAYFVPGSVGRAVERVPVVGKGLDRIFQASNEHFGRTLNVYRLEFANNAFRRFKAAGLEGDALNAAMFDAMDGVNRAFGWTSTRPSTLEEMAAFAPRYTRASVETLIKAVSDGGIQGNMARQHLGLMLAEGATLTFLANSLRGYETTFDPRDPNFLRVRNVAGLDISPFGTYNTLFTGLGRATIGMDPGGAARRFVETKLSPAFSHIYYFTKGETFLGEPLDRENPMNAVRELGKTALPFGIQNLIDEGPASAIVGSTGLSNNPVTAAEKRDFRRDELARQRFGKSYGDLSGTQKAQINEHPDIRGYQKDIDEKALAKGGDQGNAVRVRQAIQNEMDANARYLAAGQDESGKPFTGKDFREAYHRTMDRAAGARALLPEFDQDKEIQGYFDLFKQAKMANGQTNYDKLDDLVSAYTAQHPGVLDKVQRAVGTRDNADMRDLREAMAQAREYYSIPPVRGMSLEDGNVATKTIALAGQMVQFGQARDRAQAFRLIQATNPDGVALARMALRRGPNREREAWRKDPDHALFAKFYGGVAAA